MPPTRSSAPIADPSAAAQERRWHVLRRRIAVGYAVLLVVLVATVGVPTDRGSLLLVIVCGLGITCVGRGWRSFGRVLMDWLPFTAVLVVYDISRGLADWVGMPLHMADLAAAERRVFGGTIPTVWLQDRFLDPGGPHWYDAVATLIYITHFLATPVLAAVLWLRNRAVWVAFISRVIALSAAGLITYVLFPAAPPWYAAREGVIGPVLRASGRGWLWLHINKAGNLLSEGQLAANPVAAMPSLHTAFATMIALFAVRRLHSAWRWVVVLYPVAMGLALVYLGEHYVIDLLVGVVYAVGVDAAVRWWEGRHPVQSGKDVTDVSDEAAGTNGVQVAR